MVPQSTVQLILGKLAQGDTLEALLYLHEIDVKAWKTTVKSVPGLQDQVQLAQAQGIHALAASVLDIAETEPDVKRARVKIDAVKWFVSKKNPKEYGDRVHHEHTHTINLQAAMGEARDRVTLRPGRDLNKPENKQLIDIPKDSVSMPNGIQPVVKRAAKRPKVVPSREVYDDDLFK